MREITNSYTLSSQPTVKAVLDGFCSSDLLIKTLREYLTRDSLDAVRDVEVLHAILKKRCDDEMPKDKAEIER